MPISEEAESRLFRPGVERLKVGIGKSVVVVDFRPFSAAPQIGHLLANQQCRAQIFRMDPVADLGTSLSYVSLEDTSERYLHALLDAGLPRQDTVVVGYCSASILALKIADLLTSHCDTAVILAFPSWPDSSMITSEIARIRVSLGAEPTGLGDIGDPREALLEIMRMLDRDVRAMAAMNALDPTSDVIAELLGQYRAWFTFLLATADADMSALQLSSPLLDVISEDEQSVPPPWLPQAQRSSTLPFPQDVDRHRDIATSLATHILDQVGRDGDD